jgi:hypothetical protein
MDYIDIHNEPRKIRWDDIYYELDKNINDKYIVSSGTNDINYYIDCFFYNLMDDFDCKELVIKYGIYKTLQLVKTLQGYDIQIKEIDENTYRYMAKTIIKHLTYQNDILANVNNGGFIPYYAIDDDTASHSNTVINDDISSNSDTVIYQVDC